MTRYATPQCQWAVCMLAAGIIAAPAAHAALSSRLGGLAYYDDVLDITWLADMNLAASNTFGLGYGTDLGDHPVDPGGWEYAEIISSDGRMPWGAALHWIDAMNAARYLGYRHWRLPLINDVGGPGCSSAECGFNVLTGSAATTVYSEMASLYYDTLANLAVIDADGNEQPGWGLANTGPFTNLQAAGYWSGLDYNPNEDVAWAVYFDNGHQDGSLKSNRHYAMAVHPGDIATVPVPAAAWLLGAGVGLLAAYRRRSGPSF